MAIELKNEHEKGDYIYLKCKVKDNEDFNIELFFEQGFNFIDDCLKNNGKIIVHCSKGISRSASMVIFYIMKKNNINFGEAFKYVKLRRSTINPNNGFIKILENIKK
jgi:dual specificity MAP kinase phosphatase